MAIAFNVLTESGEDTDNTTFTTASVSPASGSIVLITVMNFENSSTQPAIGSISGCGLTWTLVREQNVDAAGADRATAHIWVGTGTPSSGTITVTWAGGATIRRPSWIVTEVTGADTTNPIVQATGTTGASAGTSGNVSFASAFADSTNNATFALYGVQNNSGTDFTTVDANLTKITWQAISYSHQTIAYKIGEEANVSGTWSSGRWGIAICEIAAGSSGLGATVGITTETDSPIALGRQKIKAAGVPTETDAAQPLARTKRLANPLVTETDAAQPIGRQKIKALGTATETDAAIAFTKPPKIVAVGTATETDSAQALGRVKVRALPIATSTEVALSIGDLKAISPATETDSAQAIGRSKARALTPATEAEAAQPISNKTKIKALGTALETDTAFPFGGVVPIFPATETDAAQPIGRTKRLAVGTATESDASQALGKIKTKAVAVATEADAAQVITPRRTQIVAVGTAVETETAISLGRFKRKAVGISTETDQAQPIIKKRGRVISPAIETESSRPLGKRKFKRVLGINVVETAMPLSVPQYRFEPPAYLVAFRQEHAWPEKRTWLGLNESFSIVRKGGVLTQVKTPNAADLAGTEGRDWFLGGRVYTVPHPVAKELLAAGYTPVLI